jgi:hypothetical protein
VIPLFLLFQALRHSNKGLKREKEIGGWRNYLMSRCSIYAVNVTNKYTGMSMSQAYNINIRNENAT